MMSQVELVCPECGTPTTATSGSRTAQDFCSVCDFPLFWARGKVTSAIAVADIDTTRRAPGIAGSRSVAPIPCPHCEELNDPAARTCLRCGGTMFVPPAPPAAVPPAPQPIVVRQEVVCRHWSTWLVVLVTACVSIAATAAIMTIF